MFRAAVLDELGQVADSQWTGDGVIQETFRVWKLLQEVWAGVTWPVKIKGQAHRNQMYIISTLTLGKTGKKALTGCFYVMDVLEF